MEAGVGLGIVEVARAGRQYRDIPFGFPATLFHGVHHRLPRNAPRLPSSFDP